MANSYDVLITENLFGDILTDEASVISDLWD
jgi:isocitrate/isopropylmalate dehydrogenase